MKKIPPYRRIEVDRNHSREEAAYYIGIGMTKLDQLIKSKDLISLKRGSRVLIPGWAILKFNDPDNNIPR